ncbi:MAG: ABC transporter ATP-binding protein [Pyrodictiaceae archaeon]
MEKRELLVAENLKKYFGGVRAVDGVSLALGYAEIVGIVGPNGAGKTTLLNILSGVLKPDAGRVLLNIGGRLFDVTGWPARKLVSVGVAKAFQTPRIFLNMTVIDNVRAALIRRKRGYFAIRGYYGLRDIEEKAWSLLSYVGLSSKAYYEARDLSHGEKKLLDVILALALEPKLLLLDEPTAGLSVSEKDLVMDVVKKLRKDLGISIIIVEHDLDVVFNVSDRVIVMYEGRILAEGSPESVQRDEKVKALYLGK